MSFGFKVILAVCSFAVLAAGMVLPKFVDASDPDLFQFQRTRNDLVREIGKKYRDRVASTREEKAAIERSFDRLATSVDLQNSGFPPLSYFVASRA